MEKGIGPAKAVSIKAALEIGRRAAGRCSHSYKDQISRGRN
jgi:DNA repair protein RadC